MTMIIIIIIIIIMMMMMQYIGKGNGFGLAAIFESVAVVQLNNSCWQAIHPTVEKFEGNFHVFLLHLTKMIISCQLGCFIFYFVSV